MHEPIHCVFSTDVNYTPHLGVVLASLLDNSKRHSIQLHVIHQNVGDDNLGKLKNVADRFAATIHFYNFKVDDYAHFHTSGHISLAAYFRLFLTDILPASVDRVVYIDADVVVREDIGHLFDMPMTGSLAAVTEPLAGDSGMRLGLPSEFAYFNSGVLLIDLAKWRDTGMRDRFVEYVEAKGEGLKFHDQDVLNAVLYDDVDRLDMRWNYQPRVKAGDARLVGVTDKEIEAASSDPAIVHFTSWRKPWLYKYDVPYEHEYLRYRKMTPWNNFRQPDKTLINISKRIYRRHIKAS